MDFNYLIKGQGIPFVFQHGLGSNLNQTPSLLQGLDDVQLISMDMPGHGKTPLPQDTRPSFDFYADQAILLMQKLGIKKPILGGISMGAGIALNIAIRFPEKLSGLVLIRPAWLDQNSPENLEILIDASKYIQEKNGKETFMQIPKFERIRDRLPNAGQSILGVFDPTQRSEIPLVLKSMISDCPFNNLELLKQIEVPCMVVGNENDPLHPYVMAQKIHENIPSSKLHKVISRYIDDVQHKNSIKKTSYKIYHRK